MANYTNTEINISFGETVPTEEELTKVLDKLSCDIISIDLDKPFATIHCECRWSIAPLTGDQGYEREGVFTLKQLALYYGKGTCIEVTSSEVGFAFEEFYSVKVGGDGQCREGYFCNEDVRFEDRNGETFVHCSRMQDVEGWYGWKQGD